MTIATSSRREGQSHTSLRRSTTSNACIPPLGCRPPPSRSKPACRPCAWFSRRHPTRSHKRHDRQPVRGASQGEQGIFVRNKELNRRIRVISGGLRGRTFSALPDRTFSPTDRKDPTSLLVISK